MAYNLILALRKKVTTYKRWQRSKFPLKETLFHAFEYRSSISKKKYTLPSNLNLLRCRKFIRFVSLRSWRKCDRCSDFVIPPEWLRFRLPSDWQKIRSCFFQTRLSLSERANDKRRLSFEIRGQGSINDLSRHRDCRKFMIRTIASEIVTHSLKKICYVQKFY